MPKQDAHMCDLSTLLDYCYQKELEDFIDQNRDEGIDLGENINLWEEKALKEDSHILGAILRLYRYVGGA